MEEKKDIKSTQELNKAESAGQEKWTMTGIETRETRLVDKQKRAYKGFINDEQIEESRKTQIFYRPDDYPSAVDPLISEQRAAEEKASAEAEAKAKAAKKMPKVRTVRITDQSKFKRLFAVLAVAVLLAIFVISYFVMQSQTAALPDKTAEVIKQTEELKTENAALKESADKLGDYDTLKELGESWERLKNKISE